MSDVGAVHEEDRLPWLEAVDDEEQRSGAGAGTLVVALVAALVALGLIVGGIFWLRDRGTSTGGGEGELIAAAQGPYKQKPAEPGGMKVEGQGDAAYAASTGADLNAAIDISAEPETPVTRTAPATPAKPSGAGAKVAAATAPAPAETPPATAQGSGALAAGGQVQLGAFSSEAKANQAWKSLSGRFAYLKPLTSSVTPVAAGGGTLYRLRANAGGDARTVCGKLKVAGETCAILSN